MVSDVEVVDLQAARLLSLNPSFNGIWSRTAHLCRTYKVRGRWVLILLLMEYGLGPLKQLWQILKGAASLNPSFNGIWSRTGSAGVARAVLAQS